MFQLRPTIATLFVAALLGCDRSPVAPLSRVDQHPAGISGRFIEVGGPVSATGGGHYDLGGLTVQFAFSAVQQPNGSVAGQFHHYANEGGGLVIDFYGAVTCVTEDPVNHHAWIGGIVTQNNSTDPDFQGDINQPGRDIWFRVLDAGEGAGAIDRTTFTGFQGSGGFLTSADYCAGQPWPAGDARTWPVTGNVSVRP
jgi:hypothetical protein